MHLNKIVGNRNLEHISELIFCTLNDQELVNCVLVCQSWKTFIYNCRFLWQRWIERLENWIISVECLNPIYRFPECRAVSEYLQANENLPVFKNFVLDLQLLLHGPKKLGGPIIIRDAIARNFVNLVGICIQSGAIDFNKDDISKRILHTACEYGHFEMIQLILNTLEITEIDVNHKSIMGDTALHVLSKNFGDHKNKSAMKLMLDNADKYGIDVHATNHLGQTPFQAMCGEPYYKMQRFCIEALDFWTDYPVDFGIQAFKRMSPYSLEEIIVTLYNEKLKSGQNTDDIDKQIGFSVDKLYWIKCAGKLSGNELSGTIHPNILDNVAFLLYEERRVQRSQQSFLKMN